MVVGWWIYLPCFSQACGEVTKHMFHRDRLQDFREFNRDLFLNIYGKYAMYAYVAGDGSGPSPSSKPGGEAERIFSLWSTVFVHNIFDGL